MNFRTKANQLPSLKIFRDIHARRILQQTTRKLNPRRSANRDNTSIDTLTTAAAEFANISKTYSSGAGLNNLSLEIPKRSIYGLLGPNGAGKSTALQILATLTPQDSGNVFIKGIDINQNPRLARSLVGYVSQETHLDKILTGREHMIFQGDLHHLPDKEISDQIHQLTIMFNMQEWLDRRTGAYSGGMRRRLEIACALMHKPQLLILDEPTTGLDATSRKALWRTLRNLKSMGCSILVSSHHIEEIEALADIVGIIDHGRLLAQGNPEQLKSSSRNTHAILRIKEFSNEDECEKACQILNSFDGVQHLIPDPEDGYSIHLFIKDLNCMQEMRLALSYADIPIFSFSHNHPSLEDIYLQATGQQLRIADKASQASRNLKLERKKAMR